MPGENNWLDGLKKQQEWALEEMVALYLPVVKAAVSKVLTPCGRQEWIDECINDVFFSCWTHGKQFRGDTPLEFKKWIYKIAKWKAIDYYRKASSNRETATELVEQQNSGSAEESYIQQEDQKKLLEAIASMEPMDQNIFIMKYFWGDKAESIAKRLGITKSAVDNRIYRGKKKLGAKVHEMEVL